MSGISVIIPTFNEEKNIRACIESVRWLKPCEVIVVDGGSMDKTREIARKEGAIVIQSPKGRGIQLQRGASIAKGKVLLFLHADTVIPHLQDIRDQILSVSDRYRGGFFRLRFDSTSLSFRAVEIFANLRAKLFCLPYGDQAIFVRRDVFDKVGGFKNYPFLEDLDFVLRARKFGKLKDIPIPVTVSSRRLKGYPLSPIIKSLRNVMIVLLFKAGLSPFKLAGLYR